MSLVRCDNNWQGSQEGETSLTSIGVKDSEMGFAHQVQIDGWMVIYIAVSYFREQIKVHTGVNLNAVHKGTQQYFLESKKYFSLTLKKRS